MRPFNRTTFLRACRDCYHYPRPYSEEPIYQWFVLNIEPKPAERWANEAVAYLDAWGAYHPPIREFGLNRARDVLPTFLTENRPRLKALDGKHLERFDPADFSAVYRMAKQLLQRLKFTHKGLSYGAQTATGKLLHYLLPHGVVMWDDKIVRRIAYDGLGGTALDFVNYQMFAQRALAELSNDSRGNSLAELTVRHSKECHLSYVEPLPKLIDEMAYDAVEARAAAKAVGSPKEDRFSVNG